LDASLVGVENGFAIGSAQCGLHRDDARSRFSFATVVVALVRASNVFGCGRRRTPRRLAPCETRTTRDGIRIRAQHRPSARQFDFTLQRPSLVTRIVHTLPRYGVASRIVSSSMNYAVPRSDDLPGARYAGINFLQQPPHNLRRRKGIGVLPKPLRPDHQ